jgi:RNA polymerase sigma-70 factor (ECF subfamily)
MKTLAVAIAPEGTSSERSGEGLSFAEVYQQCFPFVWRSVLRLGIPEASVDDVAQEVFIIIHRQLPMFEGRSSLRTWVYGILWRVVSEQRRARRTQEVPRGKELDALPAISDLSADGELERQQARALIDRILSVLDDKKREVFVLAELEQLTVPEIAEITGTNLNTIYARLRAAREEFEQAARRLEMRDRWRAR